jgi:hypothetical protein
MHDLKERGRMGVILTPSTKKIDFSVTMSRIKYDLIHY